GTAPAIDLDDSTTLVAPKRPTPRHAQGTSPPAVATKHPRRTLLAVIFFATALIVFAIVQRWLH
ncbi:MAG TPA: hypothetical protein VGO00_12490, partial [Kofleriaceae bacterium]|nr:hypothetical protein [Kofleriaceae bacterium]